MVILRSFTLHLCSGSCLLARDRLRGRLGDRLRVKRLLLAMMAAQVVGILAAVHLGSAYPLVALGLGISGGLFSPIATIAFPRFFPTAPLMAAMCNINGETFASDIRRIYLFMR